MVFTAAGSEISHHHSVLNAQGTNRHRTGSGVCSIVISQGVPVVKDVGGVCGESFAAAKNLVGFFGSGNSPRFSRFPSVTLGEMHTFRFGFSVA